jgi:hypothetical protein
MINEFPSGGGRLNNASRASAAFSGAALLNNTACFPLSGGYVEQRFQRKLQRDDGGSHGAHLAR